MEKILQTLYEILNNNEDEVISLLIEKQPPAEEASLYKVCVLLKEKYGE